MKISALSPKSALTAAALVAAALTLVTPASASTITFGSYGGTVAPAGLSNTPILYNNTQAGHPVTTYTTGTASAISASYLTPIAGTSYVSYDPNTEITGDNGGITVYTTTYTGNLAGDTGTLLINADDSVITYLNGVMIGNTAASTYNTPYVFSIASGIFVNGLNTLTFDVTNANATNVNGGPTNFDFKATATSPTPEPSSIVMLGTGLLSAAGFLRRRIAR